MFYLHAYNYCVQNNTQISAPAASWLFQQPGPTAPENASGKFEKQSYKESKANPAKVVSENISRTVHTSESIIYCNCWFANQIPLFKIRTHLSQETVRWRSTIVRNREHHWQSLFLLRSELFDPNCWF